MQAITDKDKAIFALSELLASVEKNSQAFWEKEFEWIFKKGVSFFKDTQQNYNDFENINSTLAIALWQIDDEFPLIYENAKLAWQSGFNLEYDLSTFDPQNTQTLSQIIEQLAQFNNTKPHLNNHQSFYINISHPKILEFLKLAHQYQTNKWLHFSVGVTNDFMNSVLNNGTHSLLYPIKHSQSLGFDLKDSNQVVWHSYPIKQNHILNPSGKIACQILQTLSAQELWTTLIQSPIKGLTFMNNHKPSTWFQNSLSANTLPPMDSFNQGLMDISYFVSSPNTKNAKFEFEDFQKTVGVFTQMMDNLIDVKNSCNYAKSHQNKRRLAIGLIGFCKALEMLGIHQTTTAQTMVKKITISFLEAGWQKALDLGKEKGIAPLLAQNFVITTTMIAMQPQLFDDGYRVGDTIKGRILHGKYSLYMQDLANESPTLSRLTQQLAENGARFTNFSFFHLDNLNVDGSFPLEQALSQHLEIYKTSYPLFEAVEHQTLSVPQNISPQDLGNLYMHAWKSKYHSCSVAGEKQYTFTLEDGSTITLNGSDIINYDGKSYNVSDFYQTFKTKN
jgi:ribonucleoside-diphosphate reductase alpha chain